MEGWCGCKNWSFIVRLACLVAILFSINFRSIVTIDCRLMKHHYLVTNFVTVTLQVDVMLPVNFDDQCDSIVLACSTWGSKPEKELSLVGSLSNERPVYKLLAKDGYFIATQKWHSTIKEKQTHFWCICEKVLKSGRERAMTVFVDWV